MENTPHAFADAIAGLLTSDLMSLNHAARRLARRYALPEVANAFMAVYAELIHANSQQK